MLFVQPSYDQDFERAFPQAKALIARAAGGENQMIKREGSRSNRAKNV